MVKSEVGGKPFPLFNERNLHSNCMVDRSFETRNSRVLKQDNKSMVADIIRAHLHIMSTRDVV